MDSRQKIFDLLTRLQILPLSDDGVLFEFITDLKFTIQEIFGPESQYLDYLKYVKFIPEIVFVTDIERERSWLNGVSQVDNLLRVILNDVKVRDNSSSASVFSESGRIDSLPAPEVSSMEDAVEQSLEEFKKSVAEEYSSLEEEGPIQEPLRSDFSFLAMASVSIASSHQELNSQEDKKIVPSVGRVLCVPGSQQIVNHEVINFLTHLPAKVMGIPKAVGQESLVDRLGHCLEAEFVVFILSADFYSYSRTQKPVDASLVVSQEAVFELGYIAAKFDRQHIVVLYQEHADFMMPTEFFDLFYIPITPSGAWKAEVVRRMKGKLAIPAGLGLSMENQPSI